MWYRGSKLCSHAVFNLTMEWPPCVWIKVFALDIAIKVFTLPLDRGHKTSPSCDRYERGVSCWKRKKTTHLTRLRGIVWSLNRYFVNISWIHDPWSKEWGESILGYMLTNRNGKKNIKKKQKQKNFKFEILDRTLTIFEEYVIGFGRIEVSASCFCILPVSYYKVCRL